MRGGVDVHGQKRVGTSRFRCSLGESHGDDCDAIASVPGDSSRLRFEKHRAYRLKHRRAIYEATDRQYDRSDKKDAEEDDGAFASTTGCRGVEGG